MTTPTTAHPVRRRALPVTHDLLDLIVTERVKEATDVVSLSLRRTDGHPLPPWAPGAHLDLLLGDGLQRQYSLCGGDAVTYRIAVLLKPAGRGGSAHVHAELREGCHVQARGPRNHFPLEPATGYRFVAGGIGITPILPMLAAVDDSAPWTLLYGGRSRSSMAFREELARCFPDERMRLVEGSLDLGDHLAGLGGGELVYACGPASLLTAVEALVPAEQLRLERFTPTAAERALDSVFEIELAQSGRVLNVPADQSILHTLQAAGLDPLYSCTEGTCGTCETGLVAGQADHRDSVLSPQERVADDTVMICVSRARSPRLVLDL
ncbi:PDR/VanB family oxidoreductase [Streptomyces sp. NBC_00440]|uniref:PDR/VanB family oxidoreductase n=1 Tax=Streptomyces sp. NBC_00440 TaxID=2975741 RepID=UPI002E1AE758